MKKSFLIVGGIVIAAAAGAGGWYYYNRQGLQEKIPYMYPPSVPLWEMTLVCRTGMPEL